MRSSVVGPGEVKMSGPKHDLWVVPYADMLTLLFAVFVVLYAIGEVKLQKLEQLRRSLSSAFRVAGSGHADQGDHEFGADPTGGHLVEGLELINVQSGPMKEFLLETLPKEFEEVAGRSLEIVLLDDTVAFRASLPELFEPGSARLREDVQAWLIDLYTGAWTYVSTCRIRIEAPDVVIGRDDSGLAVRSDVLCERRLSRLRSFLRRIPAVENRQVITEFRPKTTVLDAAGWERYGTIEFAFANP